ncbi:glycosyltransferase family 29 protein [Rhizobium skierniewicense]|uniref:glycosyltransferase family 29 protein n=1 Tax=Rhizobium skierniewicense TaxID=984260 RepID=UPI0015729565|nr:Urease operon accessory protein [Rhizobium skierniewicense]
MPRNIAIVGNGAFAPSDASRIDNCDVVIRFNDCRSVGDGGSRTDVVAVCNTGRPASAMIRQRTWRETAAIAHANAIWCVRDGGKFAELKPGLIAQQSGLDDFCDDYTDEFAHFATETAKVFTVIPRRYHDRVDLELKTRVTSNYVVPSSGMIAVSYVIGEVAVEDDTVLLAGFGHQGWSGHSFRAERDLIDQYIADGLLRRI